MGYRILSGSLGNMARTAPTFCSAVLPFINLSGDAKEDGSPKVRSCARAARVLELVLISLLAAFCGLSWARQR
jgi:hypothetical protein